MPAAVSPAVVLSAPRPWRLPAVVVVLALVLALAATGCSSHPKGASSQPSMSIEMSSGTATVSGAGRTRNVSGTTGIGVGYRIVVDSGGLATLRLSGGRSFEIAPGEAAITAPDTVQLVTGTVLAQLTAPATVDFPGASVQSSSGVFRVDGGGPSRVAVYSGSASVSVQGTTQPVPAFRQVVVANGQIAGPSGLRLVGTGDAIDQQFLSSAIGLESQLNSFANGLDAQLGTTTGSAFFSQVLPSAVDVSYAQPFFTEPRSAVLIGWEIATHVAGATPADLGTNFDVVMVLWLQGEPWGVIADEFNVSGDTIFTGLTNDITRLKLAGSPQPAPSEVPQAGGTPAPKASSSPNKQGVTVTPIEQPTPTPNGLAALLNPVTGLLSQILNLLLPAPTPAPSSSPSSSPTPSSGG